MAAAARRKTRASSVAGLTPSEIWSQSYLCDEDRDVYQNTVSLAFSHAFGSWVAAKRLGEYQ